MADPRFFNVAGPYSLRQLAKTAGAELGPGADPDRVFADVAPLDNAGPEHVSFLDNRRYLSSFSASRAGACLVDPELAGRAPAGMALLLTKQPYRGYALVAQAFYPEPPVVAGRHETAVVDPTARIGPGTRIGPGVAIGAGVEIGRDCHIMANAVIEDGVVIGDETEVGSNASLSHCLVGCRCRLHAGVCIGNRGFGFAIDPEGFVDVPQLGRVIIEDDVEVGANTTIDRGSAPDTVIGAGSKIDNLVQIGHNVRLGRGCVLVAQVGVSGSTTLGDSAVIGGQAGLTGHLRIGAGAQVAAQAGVMRDVAPGSVVGGSPAVPVKDWHRQTVALARLAKGKGK